MGSLARRGEVGTCSQFFFPRCFARPIAEISAVAKIRFVPVVGPVRAAAVSLLSV
jgi:hypothetical protein